MRARGDTPKVDGTASRARIAERKPPAAPRASRAAYLLDRNGLDFVGDVDRDADGSPKCQKSVTGP